MSGYSERRAHLQDVQRASHVTLAQPQERLSPVCGQLHLLLLNDVLQPPLDFRDRQRAKSGQGRNISHALTMQERVAHGLPETGAARLDGWDDAIDVVADDAEAHVLRVLFDDCVLEYWPSAVSGMRRARRLCRGHTSSKGSLRLLRHHVGLVQNDELVRGAGLRACQPMAVASPAATWSVKLTFRMFSHPQSS